MPIFALRPGDIDFVSPTHGLEDIAFPAYRPQLPEVPLMFGFEALADFRRFSVSSGNYLSREIARKGGWLAMKNIDAGYEKTGAFAIVLTMFAASVPQTFTKFMPFTNPYTGIPTAVLDLYNIHHHGFEYLWE